MSALNLFILSAILAFSSAQPPQECMEPPKVTPEQCCPGITPPYMTKMSQCGAPSGPPSGPPSCEIIKCTFGDYLAADGSLNQAAFVSGMNSFYDSNYRSMISTAMSNCLSLATSSGNCPIMKFGGCFAMEMFKTCPDNGNADCTAAKSLIEKCAPPKQ